MRKSNTKKIKVDYEALIKGIFSRFDLKTNQQIADKLGYSKNHIGLLRNGKLEEVPLPLKKLLHYVFHINLDYLEGKTSKIFDDIEDKRIQKDRRKRDRRKQNRRH